MELCPIEHVDAGIDYLTVTANEPEKGTKLASSAEFLLRSELEKGNLVRPWTMLGFEGACCGSVQAGLKHDMGIVRLSGDVARAHWFDFYQRSDSCSRIDFQTTYRFDSDATEIITRCFRAVRRRYKPHRGDPDVSMFQTIGKAATIYVGQRISEKWLRIYDKGRESKRSDFQNCVRFELELKGRTAKANARSISDSVMTFAAGDFDSQLIANVDSAVREYVARAGITLTSPLATQALVTSANDVSDLRRRFDWLESQVSPTVIQLCKLGLARQVIESLFGSDIRARCAECGRSDMGHRDALASNSTGPSIAEVLH